MKLKNVAVAVVAVVAAAVGLYLAQQLFVLS